MPQDLYFCHPNRGTCADGWYFSDIQQVITQYGVMDEGCVPYNPLGAAGGSKSCGWQQPCVPAMPVTGKFEVVSLPSIAKMQAHLMAHGAVVTALIVNMDFLKYWSTPTAEPYRWAGQDGAGACALLAAGASSCFKGITSGHRHEQTVAHHVHGS